jgi:FemAB-related protein (PEP-CTERM system-associated)
MYRIIEYSDEYKDSWNKFVNEYGNIFHLIEWKEILEAAFGYRSLYLMAIDESDKIAGVIPMILCRNLLMKKAAVSLPFVNYLDICCRDKETFRFIIGFIKDMPVKYRTDYAEVRLMGQEDEEAEVFIDKGNYTFLLPLVGGEEQVMSLSSGSNRNHTKKTAKNKWFSVSFEDKGLEDFYRVYCRTVKRLGSPAPAYGFFSSIRRLLPDNTVILTAKDNDNDRVIGGMFLFLWKDTVYYYWGGALTEYNRKYINNFMYWEAAKYGISKGFKFLDLGRSPYGSGTYKFKEQWGAGPVQLKYCRFGKDLRQDSGEKGIAVKKENFRLFISMWKHMPGPVTKVIGRHLIKYIMP